MHSLKVAIVANINARKIDKRVIDAIAELIEERKVRVIHTERLFTSNSLNDLKNIAKILVDFSFDIIFTAGGDGTFTQVVSAVMNLKPKQQPTFGIIQLGTGNSMARALRVAYTGITMKSMISDITSGELPKNAKARLKFAVAQELDRAVDDSVKVKQAILRVNDYWTPFTGVGLDATVLHDYAIARRLLNRFSFISEKIRGPIDYAAAISGITFWRYVLSGFPKVEIFADHDDAFRLDREGNRTDERIKPGGLIYRGSISFCAASTIRYYGWGVNVFPQAKVLNGRFQLRFTNLGIPEMIPLIPSIILGEIEHDRIWDYACKSIKIVLLGRAYFQIGGDLMPQQKEVRINISNIKVLQGSLSASPAPPVNV